VTSDVQQWIDRHDNALSEVLGDMLQYLPRASTHMLPLPPGWEPQRDILLQQVIWEEVRRRTC
jgi:hypothetical protein